MIKENVLSKNLVTGEISYRNIDTEFEIENLNGNIIQDSPWIEISIEDNGFVDFTQNKHIQSLRIQKKTRNRPILGYNEKFQYSKWHKSTM